MKFYMKANMKRELAEGKKIETEHTATIKKLQRGKSVPVEEAAELIAKDHLKEDQEYYTKLIAMESYDKLSGVDKKIIDTIKNAKILNDEKVIHKLAEELKMNTHKLEERIYNLFKQVL